MEQPVLVDVLPEGTSVDTSTDDYAKIAEDDTSGLQIRQRRQISFGQGNTGGEALLLYLDKPLAAGDNVKVDVTVKTSLGTSAYGNPITNVAFATSAKEGVKTSENPAGASFMGKTSASDDNWAELLSDVARRLLGDRAEALTETMDDMGLYGYISAHTDAYWSTGSTLALTKASYGSADESKNYSSTRLAKTKNGGQVFYELSVTNIDQTNSRTNLTVIDVLPSKDDVRGSDGAERGSQWPLYFDKITSVKTGDRSVTDYIVYYYTEPVNGNNAKAVYDAVSAAKQGSCPEGWEELKNETDKNKITAFIVALDNTKWLGPNESLTIEYTTNVGNLDQENVNERAYKNAVNNFVFDYKDYVLPSGTEQNSSDAQALREKAAEALAPVISPSVSATLIPGNTKVGGHVWIDADNNGKQDDGGIAGYSSYAIVEELLDDIIVTLLKYTDKNNSDSATSSGSVRYIPDESSDWYKNANFVFEELTPAEPTDEDNLYDDTTLKLDMLRGDNPATYRIEAELSSQLANIFELTDHGGSYKSPKPDAIPDEEQKDSNFKSSNTEDPTDSSGSSSERFFLWWMSDPNVWDNTKDIGFTPYRTLKIEKHADDDIIKPVEGAKFEIYGPYNMEEELTGEDLASGKLLARGETDENGTVQFDLNNGETEDSLRLRWFQKYIIVETSSCYL